jgi:Tat protein translocase TatB subunit
MFGIGPMELMVVLLIALVVVGPKRLPEIGRTIGKALHELRKVQTEVSDTIRFDFDTDQDEPPPRATSWTPPDEDEPDEGFGGSDGDEDTRSDDLTPDHGHEESERESPESPHVSGTVGDAPAAGSENGHAVDGPADRSETAGGLE